MTETLISLSLVQIVTGAAAIFLAGVMMGMLVEGVVESGSKNHPGREGLILPEGTAIEIKVNTDAGRVCNLVFSDRIKFERFVTGYNVLCDRCGYTHSKYDPCVFNDKYYLWVRKEFLDVGRILG